MALLLILLIGAVWHIVLPRASAQGTCFNGTNGLYAYDDGPAFQTCNVDPSLLNYRFVMGFYAHSMSASDSVTARATAVYTGTDAVQSTDYATPILLPSSANYFSFIAEFSSLPYSNILVNAPITLKINYNAVGCSTGGVYQPISVGHTQTLFYTDTTSTSTSTVPSVSTTTSTLTNQQVADAPTFTSTVTTTAGVATVVATPFTSTTTHTILRKTVVRTVLDVQVRRTSKSCLPPNPTPAKARRRLDVLERRQASSHYPEVSSFLLPYCYINTLASTTYTTATYFDLVSVTSGVSLSTTYTTTVTTSTYTPTEMDYQNTPSSTTTVTPTVYQRRHTVVGRVTRFTTTTITVTETKYPLHATPCSTAK